MASDNAITSTSQSGTLAVVESGVDFASFPKLPLEIQRMIWRYSACIPQVVGIKQVFIDDCSQHVPVTVHSQQLFVCKEARREAMKVLLHVEVYPKFKSSEEADMPRIFINPYTDTLWMPAARINDRWDDLDNMGNWYRFGGRSQQDLQIPKLALPAEFWRDQLCGDLMGLMRKLSILKVEEVIAVVGKTNMGKAKHVNFIKPIARTQYMLATHAPVGLTWEQLQETDMTIIRDQQADQASDRKDYFKQAASTGVQDREPEDASNWTVKRVQYMQATEFQNPAL